MTFPSRHVTSQELKTGITYWKPHIINALQHNMTSDQLVFHVLSLVLDKYYAGNVDRDTDLIIAALNELIEEGRVKVEKVQLNEKRQGRVFVETFLSLY
jgi:hypothetical protein